MFELWLILFSAIAAYNWFAEMHCNRADIWLFMPLAVISVVIAPELSSKDVVPELPSITYEKFWGTFWGALLGFALHQITPDKINRTHILIFAVSGFIIGFAVSPFAVFFCVLAFFTHRYLQRRRAEILESLGAETSHITQNPILSALSAAFIMSLAGEIYFREVIKALHGPGEVVFLPLAMPEETVFLLLGTILGFFVNVFVHHLQTRSG